MTTTASTQSTLELLKLALDRLDEEGPIMCAAHVSHAVELLRQHMADHPRALSRSAKHPPIPQGSASGLRSYP